MLIHSVESPLGGPDVTGGTSISCLRPDEADIPAKDADCRPAN